MADELREEVNDVVTCLVETPDEVTEALLWDEVWLREDVWLWDEIRLCDEAWLWDEVWLELAVCEPVELEGKLFVEPVNYSKFQVPFSFMVDFF